MVGNGAELPMTALWSRRRDERGMTIVLALVVCLVVFTLGATWVGISMHQVDGSGRDRGSGPGGWEPCTGSRW